MNCANRKKIIALTDSVAAIHSAIIDHLSRIQGNIVLLKEISSSLTSIYDEEDDCFQSLQSSDRSNPDAIDRQEQLVESLSDYSDSLCELIDDLGRVPASILSVPDSESLVSVL